MHFQLYQFILSCSFCLLLLQSCNAQSKVNKSVPESIKLEIGAERYDSYLPLLESKRIALVVNQTSTVKDQHLVDIFHGLGIEVVKVFAPEHGFRGEADAGANIKDGVDAKTGIPIVSLYGNKKKPTEADLKGIDVVVFDIQDVGVRFYTYISTMHYVMEACAEFGVSFLLLDRPNPNGFYVDGPVLKPSFKSFVGLHPIPVVHGLTVGELANMIKGESWMTYADKLKMTVISCTGYDHNMHYSLPIRPSPNLPNDKAILWYPSTCFFEGTTVSLGRGTDHPFMWIGHPLYPDRSFSFIPESRKGASDPPQKGQVCYGKDYTQVDLITLRHQMEINLEPLYHFYHILNAKNQFFLENNFIDKLAGTDQLRLDLVSGKTIDQIRQSWVEELIEYKALRKKYLLYGDFE
jgi:uncharacterized protein YbbC (DUF1343 family)